MTSVDLFCNPFVLLGVDLSASAQEVAEAFEEAVTQGRYSEADLTAARQALLRPLLRLQQRFFDVALIVAVQIKINAQKPRRTDNGCHKYRRRKIERRR
jgi:hypothetical protein